LAEASVRRNARWQNPPRTDQIWRESDQIWRKSDQIWRTMRTRWRVVRGETHGEFGIRTPDERVGNHVARDDLRQNGFRIANFSSSNL
jgi:hypothetical protein